jgi:hypothetical protein
MDRKQRVSKEIISYYDSYCNRRGIFRFLELGILKRNIAFSIKRPQQNLTFRLSKTLGLE